MISIYISTTLCDLILWVDLAEICDTTVSHLENNPKCIQIQWLSWEKWQYLIMEKATSMKE